ncbi:MAG: class I SAM-dependent methyltransferase [Anaerolineae bacterium]
MNRLRRVVRSWLAGQGDHEPVMLGTQQAYTLWAARYPPEAHNPLMALEERAMKALLPEVKGKRIADLGTGTGRYVHLLSQLGAESVVGLDQNWAMLHAGSGERIQAALQALPVADGAFDGLVCGLTLGHCPALEPVFAEVSRILKPGGWFLFSDFHPVLAHLGMARSFVGADGRCYAVEHHAHGYADYFHACLAAGQQVVDVREPDLVPPGHHESIPAVLVMLCQKGR